VFSPERASASALGWSASPSPSATRPAPSTEPSNQDTGTGGFSSGTTTNVPSFWHRQLLKHMSLDEPSASFTVIASFVTV
jgi:hypothetical protein